MASSLNLVEYGFAGFVTIVLIRNIVTGRLKEDFEVFKQVQLKEWARMGLVCPILVLATVSLATALYDLPVKLLQWSWLSLLAGPKDKDVGTNLGVSAGASIPYFGVIFVLLLFLNLPGLARNEEEIYREGTKNWTDAIPRSLKFGIMHCLVGVPVAAGIALALPGLWFTSEYFKGGVEQSTRVHAIYNMILVGLLAFYVMRQGIYR